MFCATVPFPPPQQKKIFIVSEQMFVNIFSTYFWTDVCEPCYILNHFMWNLFCTCMLASMTCKKKWDIVCIIEMSEYVSHKCKNWDGIKGHVTSDINEHREITDTRNQWRGQANAVTFVVSLVTVVNTQPSLIKYINISDAFSLHPSPLWCH